MELVSSALDNSCLEYVYHPRSYRYDLELFLFKEALSKIKAKIGLAITRMKNIKVQLSLKVKLTKFRDLERIDIEPFFNSTTKAIFDDLFLDQTIRDCFAEIIKFYDTFVHQGSGYVISKIQLIKLYISVYKPLRGGKPPIHGLPKEIVAKRAVVNIDCEKEMCFIYCVLAHLYPVKKNPQRATHYTSSLNRLNWANVELPMPLKAVPKFEADNSVAICVFCFDKKGPYPVYASQKIGDVSPTREIDLLLHKNHYYLIKSLSRLIGHSFGSKRGKTFTCKKCMCLFKSEKQLVLHRETCNNDTQRCILPELGAVKKFTNFRAQFMNEFVIYYDFESIQSTDHGFLKRTGDAKHLAIAVAAKRVCSEHRYDGPLFLYTGVDAVEKFLEYLQAQYLEIQCILHTCYQPAKLNQSDLDFHHRQTHCFACKHKFTHHKEKRIDHDHLSGRYRACLCNTCNLTYAATSRKLICIAHGGLSYDIKLLLSTFENTKRKHNLRVIAKNKENFHCVYLDSFIFIDSYNFLGASLQTLADSLRSKGENSFTYTRQLARTSNQFNLLMRKGVFCYDYLDCPSKLEQTRLPSKQLFFDKLKAKPISNDDYIHAKKVWVMFNCKTLKDYMENYLSCDVLLLTDIFEAFRSMCFKYYGLDCTSYMSLPQYSFDALLKHSEVELELFHDIDMLNFVQKGIRGGTSCIFKRHAVANNSHLRNHDKNKPNSYLLYVDANNLYGFCMRQALPISNFRFLSDQELENFDIMSVKNDSATGYILEVDLFYPDHLHDSHNDFPLAPQKMRISVDQWSPWMHKVAEIYKLRKKDGAEKLITSFYEKKNYVVHISTLQLYIKLGLVVNRLHKVLSFRQIAWMKEFIDFNSAKRKEAVSKFEQDLFKLMTNSLFGKALENCFKKIDFRLVTNKKRFIALTSRPNFKEFSLVNRGLVGVHMKRTEVMLDKQISVGFTILDLAKRHMYKFHYSVMKEIYGDNIDLCFTDTDSLLYHIRTEDVYDDMKNNIKYFDTSNYPTDHFLFSDDRKKLPGPFKDEMSGHLIEKFIGLKAKCYTIVTEDRKTVKKAKGLKGHIADELTYKDYEAALSLAPIKKHDFFAIRSFKNNLYTTRRSVSGLSPLDDKRFICDDGITTLAYGHKDIC